MTQSGTAKVVLHLPDDQHAALEAGKASSFYLRVKNLVEARGGRIKLAPRFAPTVADGDLHIVDNGRKPNPDVLMATVAYLDGCWHLDGQGVLADSSIGSKVFNADEVDEAQAEAYVAKLQARFASKRASRYHQKKAIEDIDPTGIVIFLQGPPPYRRGHAFMGRDEMIRTVLTHAGARPVYIKPHPLRKEEGIAVIKQMQSEGYAPIKTNANVHDLLRQAAVTVSANSAASIEGFLHGTPTLLFARSDFAAAAEEVREASDFAQALERALTQQRDYTKFLFWYFTQCLWLEADDFDAQVLARFDAMGFDAKRLGFS